MDQVHYFQAISTRRRPTKTTKTKLNIQEPLRTINYLGEKAEERQDELRGKFCEIYLSLREGFNVILSGFGSKRKLLDEFADSWLRDEKSLTICGFYPEITSRNVIYSLKNLLDADGSDTQSLVNAASELKHDTFLVVHSLDFLLSSNAASLKQLLVNIIIGSRGMFHLIASVDHVNSALLWDLKDRNRLNLLFHKCSTFESFRIEREYLATFKSKGGSVDELNLSSVQHVYDSLTPNAQNIFLLILRHHLKNESPNMPQETNESPIKSDESEQETEDTKPQRKKSRQQTKQSSEMTFSRLYKLCREEYLVNSETTLRAQLTEFQDHKILKVGKQSDGNVVVDVLISPELIDKFLETV